MKHASTALKAFLNGLGPGQSCSIADLLTIIQADGTITRLTNAPVPIHSTSLAVSFSDATVYTFSPNGPKFSRGQTRTLIGFEVDDMTLTLSTDPLTQTIGGLTWATAAATGALDNATIVLETVFMVIWGDTSLGTLIRFKGIVGAISAASASIELEVKALISILSRSMPRTIYQPQCGYQLYDANCTLDPATFTFSGAIIGSSSTRSLIFCSLPNNGTPNGDYTFGTIKFTSGVNVDIARNVRIDNNSVISVTPPLPFVPGTGDTLEGTYGCDKQQSTCVNRFANFAHFRGFPAVPVPEMAG